MLAVTLAVLTSACHPISDVSRPRNNEEEPVQGEETDASGEQPPLIVPEPAAPIAENLENTDFSGLFIAPSQSAPEAINAPYGALYNLSDDVFIYGKRVDERVYPSGAVKLLTALTVYDALSPSFIFTVGDETDMVKAGSGVAGLMSGQRLDMEAMLTALLIPVGNDAAYTISVNTAREKSGSSGGGNREMNDYFLKMMNDYAEKTGCTGSNFSNPDGFHAADNYSTVRDLALIAAAAATNPLITAICGKLEHQVSFESGGSVTWSNSNSLLTLENWDIRGLRTGYTDESGFSAQILAYIDGKYYIAVVSGNTSSAERQNDIIRLLQMARDGYNADIIELFDRD
ncbi:MAG: hypothetical protein FWG70_10735 [Oscillospiraceae bacterium]|nr:hypothetical protein [Oscillospiraceae bacterium]